MTKISFNILCITLISFVLLNSCSTRNLFSDFDLKNRPLSPKATGFRGTGNAISDRFGSSVSTAGDFNNDGYDDIIIGAYGKNSNQGAVYIIYGGEESSFLDIDLQTTSLNPLTTGFMITGNAAGDYFGFSVSTAGDIDKDGFDDIIIGTSQKNTAYVIYGRAKSSMSNIDLSSMALLPESTGFTITGYAAGDNFGVSVSTAGDINNDGYDDIIIGANSANSNKGVAYVIYGGPKSTRSDIALSSTILDPELTGFTIKQTTAADFFGSPVSAAGDIDNDGFDDIIIGTSRANNNRGAVYVIYGGPTSSMSDIIISSTLLNPSTAGFVITGNAAFDYFGWSVSTAGDINNDGFDDIIAGAEEKNAAYVFYGGPRSSMPNLDLSSTELSPTSTGFMIKGNADYLGVSVSTAGDINNDGYDDIIVGTNSYVAYVIYGGEKLSMSNINLGSTSLSSTSKGFKITGDATGFGSKVSRAGDINNDGYDDIIVGAPHWSSSRGAVYVIYAGCSKNCKQCSSESVCTECENSYRMYKSECFDTCPEGTLVTSSTTCEDCSAHCNHCSSKSVCTECKSPYRLYQSKCVDSCPDTMFLSSATCEDCPNNCNHCTSPSVCTECISPFVFYESQCLTSCPKATFNDNNECKDCPSNCASCISRSSCQVCSPGFTLSNFLCVTSVTEPPSSSSDQEVQGKAIQRISAAAKVISSVVCVGRTVAPFAMLVSKTTQNTRYLNLSVTNDLSEVYQTWDRHLPSWEVPNSFSSNEDDFEASSPLFARYGTGSPFLVNFWPTLANIAGGLTLFITCFVLQRLLEKSKHENLVFLVQYLVAGSFSFTLIQAYASFDDILFYLVLDIKANPLDSFFSLASLISAVVFLALGCLLLLFNFWTVKKYQKIKSQRPKDIQAFNKKNKHWSLYYLDFNDNNLWTQSFLAFIVLRSALSSLIISVLYDYPLIQTLCLVAIDVLIILFLYVKSPFKTLRGKLAQYLYEAITLLVHLCTFILSLKPSDTTKNIFSTAIIYLNIALIIGAVGFMFFEVYKTISDMKRAARLRERQVVPQKNQEIQNLTQTKSPLHAPETEEDRKRPDWANLDQTISPGNFHFLHEATTPNGDVESPIRKLPLRALNIRKLKKGSIYPVNN